MVLRKINAGISLICVVLLMGHAISHATWMLSIYAFPKIIANAPWILFGLMMLHAIISIVLAILGHKGAEKRECKTYAKLNVATIIQRIGGVLLIVFTLLHVLGTIGVVNPPPLVHAVLPPIFFAFSLMHVAVSTSKAFITLGIGNAKTIKIIDIIVKVLCALTLMADVIGFYLYLS